MQLCQNNMPDQAVWQAGMFAQRKRNIFKNAKITSKGRADNRYEVVKGLNFGVPGMTVKIQK